MPKPAEMDDAAFSKAKNDKLAMCHDGLGVAAVKTGKFDEAIAELTQSMQLSSTPDPVDYYLLGVADEQASHFTDAIAAFHQVLRRRARCRRSARPVWTRPRRSRRIASKAPK